MENPESLRVTEVVNDGGRENSSPVDMIRQKSPITQGDNNIEYKK